MPDFGLAPPELVRSSTCPLREREVLGLVAEALWNKAIAGRLFVTERTVEAHVKQIFLELRLNANPDSHRRVLAVLRLLAGGRVGRVSNRVRGASSALKRCRHKQRWLCSCGLEKAGANGILR
ncbi:MAG: helix-turn-helix transcriptional regulator [Actinobacteria bacterium]|nr:helix-turn-helix transcriptional regulator [Actinomycetota bacterium]